MRNIENILNNFQKACDFTPELPEDIREFENYLLSIGIQASSINKWPFYQTLLSMATDMYEGLRRGEVPIEYTKEPYDILGLSLKYIYAWERLSRGLIEKISSVELLLETSNDLQCSLVLIGEKYLKQSLQIIRNYCETCVAILYFIHNRPELTFWLNDNEDYYFPNFRKMLDELKAHELISSQDRKFLRNKYTELNNSVHNKRRRLNMNLDNLDDKNRSEGFKDLGEWSLEIISIVKFMLILYIKLFENKSLLPNLPQ